MSLQPTILQQLHSKEDKNVHVQREIDSWMSWIGFQDRQETN